MELLAPVGRPTLELKVIIRRLCTECARKRS